MKKLSILIIVLSLCLLLAACGEEIDPLLEDAQNPALFTDPYETPGQELPTDAPAELTPLDPTAPTEGSVEVPTVPPTEGSDTMVSYDLGCGLSIMAPGGLTLTSGEDAVLQGGEFTLKVTTEDKAKLGLMDWFLENYMDYAMRSYDMSQYITDSYGNLVATGNRDGKFVFLTVKENDSSFFTLLFSCEPNQSQKLEGSFARWASTAK